VTAEIDGGGRSGADGTRHFCPSAPGAQLTRDCPGESRPLASQILRMWDSGLGVDFVAIPRI
jgi:hypothetical protein